MTLGQSPLWEGLIGLWAAWAWVKMLPPSGTWRHAGCPRLRLGTGEGCRGGVEGGMQGRGWGTDGI